ncbi:hypothetical protein KQI63_02020 [bacterium]|nr:hypothetical protein [bacterium]
MSSRKTLLWTAVFAIAMGWLEAAVVVYMRELYYPGGFEFPLKMIEINIGVIEIAREVATIMMLIAVGMLAGRTRLERFGYLMYTFGIWDIVYYIGLKLAIGWPESLLTWDLLFLIPLPWIGPVLAPVLVSIAMIAACVVIVLQNDRKRPMHPGAWSWAGLILCGLIIIVSFIVDYKTAFTTGVPERYRWELFLVGYLPGLAVFYREWIRAERV